MPKLYKQVNKSGLAQEIEPGDFVIGIVRCLGQTSGRH